MLISVIIPCYNAEKYLSACLDSVLNQSYSDIEIIAVDNNSSDGTWNLLEQYHQQYPHKIRIEKEPERGASKARNKGLKLSKGEWVQFLDSDDTIHPDKFIRQLDSINEFEKVDVIVSDRIDYDSNLDNELERHFFSEIESTPLNVCISKIIITGNPIYRRSVVVDIGGYNELLPNAQDWEFHIRLALRNVNFKYVPGPFLNCRKLSTSLSADWVKVSFTMGDVVAGYWNAIANFKEKIASAARTRIFFIFYMNMLHAKDNQQFENVYKQYRDTLGSFNGLKGVTGFIVSIFGLKLFVRFKRLFS